ncbi:hypothetical protein T439DRAFT_377027 [Meredithblackwellia eburnea MCA 4105]
MGGQPGDPDDPFTPAMVKKILDSPKFHLRRKGRLIFTIGLIGPALNIALVAAALSIGNGVTRQYGYFSFIYGGCILFSALWSAFSLYVMRQLHIMDDPSEMWNQYVCIFASALASTGWVWAAVYQINQKPDAVQEAFMAGCEYDCASKYNLFYWGPIGAAITTYILAIPEFLLCWNIYKNPLINPSREQINEAKKSLAAEDAQKRKNKNKNKGSGTTMTREAKFAQDHPEGFDSESEFAGSDSDLEKQPLSSLPSQQQMELGSGERSYGRSSKKSAGRTRREGGQRYQQV